MTERPALPGADPQLLRFACSCASAADVADVPWAAISKQRKINDGTKELILNAIHDRPLTIAQLAQRLGLSAAAVHRHVAELLASELIREATVSEAERRSSLERYYRPNFPVVLVADRLAFLPILEELARAFAEAFRAEQQPLQEAFARTSLPARGEGFESLLHYLYTTAARLARERLEAEDVLPPWPEHQDGSRWIWWAEEPPEVEVE
jgi:DNA-binding transcriptional ArsR family regulator